MTENLRYISSRRLFSLAALIASLFCYCRSDATPTKSDGSRVLVVINQANPDSIAIGRYYARKRHIPDSNVLMARAPETEDCTEQEFAQIRTAVRECIRRRALNVDYIVLTRGIPIRVQGGLAVDSLLTRLDSLDRQSHVPNPYFLHNEPFHHSTFGIYLVTRLDGYTRADCLRLVDNALAARPLKGTFLFNTAPKRERPGFAELNDSMELAQRALAGAGFKAILAGMEGFAGGYRGLMGYYSWGSNDRRFRRGIYNSLSFAPGAIAETIVSTSGRTFRDRLARGQSLIADLIAQGVTGCKGYVSEPYSDSMALCNILFARYISGYNLAESFYMSSRWLSWKDVVIGDPLCAPYSK